MVQNIINGIAISCNVKIQILWEFFDSELVSSCLYDSCNDESPFTSFDFLIICLPSSNKEELCQD
jgi:hypothetical protein